MPEVELIHEAFIRFGKRPACSYHLQGFDRADAVAVDQVSADASCGAGLAHGTKWSAVGEDSMLDE